MQNSTLYLPGFHLQSLRKTPRSARQILLDKHKEIRRKSLSQLGDYFSKIIPEKLIQQDSLGSFSRRRVFSKANTFWAFFSQVLDADGGCKEVVRKLQAMAIAKELAPPSSSTSAYCQARQKLSTNMLEEVLAATTASLHQDDDDSKWHGHRVVVVDGTGLSMPDTSENQALWPQQRTQTPGCGFPQARLCGCFDLHTGALLSYRLGSKKRNELLLLRQQMNTFEAGDIMLGDKGFCSYYDVWQFQQNQVDTVFTLARGTPVEAASSQSVLGDDDLLIQWPKPSWNKKLSYTKDVWEKLPQFLTLRQIKVTVKEPGFRVKSYHLITTLTDPDTYPAEDLADLYYIELFFRDIKTTMGMDILRCFTPSMVKKEILMHLIVYNCLRSLIFEAAGSLKGSPRNISFKSSLQALRQWQPLPNNTETTAD